ncbi:MAG: hypothetical protein ACK58N_06940 [Synechocystis sp.]|jgi:hypothetical protein
MLFADFRHALRSCLTLTTMLITTATATPVFAQPLIATNLPILPTQSLLSTPLPTPVLDLDDPTTDEAAITSDADPLNSPYPVPWQWITQTQQDYASQQKPGLRYYRSPALVSPSGKYAAYSRIEVRAEANLYESKVLSVLFLENLQTGELKVIRAESPIARYLQKVGENSEEMSGVISILIPVSWSGDGDRLLARQLEGAFNSSDISDYAVIWKGKDGAVKTLAANPDPTMEVSATLLGWHQDDPDQVLFKVSHLGEEEEDSDETLVSVSLTGDVQATQAPAVIGYGERVSRSWTGVQAIR